MKQLRKIIDVIANVYFVVGATCFVLLLALNSVEIVSRYFFKHSNIWSQEVSLLLVCWVIFLSFGKVVIKNEDISITFLIDKFNPKIYKVMQMLNSLLLTFTAGYMLIKTNTLIEQQVDKTTLIANIPNLYYTLPLALVLILVCIHCALRFFELLSSPSEKVEEYEQTSSSSEKGVV